MFYGKFGACHATVTLHLWILLDKLPVSTISSIVGFFLPLSHLSSLIFDDSCCNGNLAIIICLVGTSHCKSYSADHSAIGSLIREIHSPHTYGISTRYLLHTEAVQLVCGEQNISLWTHKQMLTHWYHVCVIWKSRDCGSSNLHYPTYSQMESLRYVRSTHKFQELNFLQ